LAHPLEPRELNMPTELPLLPVRDMVVFPYMIIPLFVGREKSIAAVEAALAADRMILLSTQKDMTLEDPGLEDIFPVGTVAMIMRMLKLPDGRLKVLVQGMHKARMIARSEQRDYFKVQIESLAEGEPPEISVEIEALMRTVRDQLSQLYGLGRALPGEVMLAVENMEDPGGLADLVASHLGLKGGGSQTLLEILDPVVRLREVKDLLAKELELQAVQNRIQNQAREEMGKSQREYYLREQLRAIQGELGESDSKAEDLAELRRRIEDAEVPEEAKDEIEKQLRRLEGMHPEAGEYALLRTYLDWLVELPWSSTTQDSFDLPNAKSILDEDHFNLEKVKERILEFLAVRKLKQSTKGPILCFVGPPGVGKTSLGKSIARAMGRKFVRISLGGVRDEAEIRGHRRTYVGALPGRIIQGIKQAGTNNPVFMLDEIDKLGADFRGDPAAALLEVLDPEQNHAFSDHYINVPFDLSKVMFIATANLLDPVPSALKDRMEVLPLSGYSAEEKLTIAERYLVPRQIEENGLHFEDLQLSRNALMRVVSEYTAEAGLRNFERELGGICRKVARRFAEGERRVVKITAGHVPKYLGPPRYLVEEERREPEVGVVTGLAWTSAGGELLNLEVCTLKGKKGLTLTGSLGDVMKESAQTALSYARSRARDFDFDEETCSQREIHIHVPAGAIPKDGPSAGVTMATALISALSGRAVRSDIAMTGEITLRGKVLPVGGIKEKILAAVRAHIKTVLLPARNARDLEEVPQHLRRKISLVLVRDMNEVLEQALVNKA